MKATGIIRRVDDLGRILIPKEVRRTIGITEGTPLELFIDKEQVIFKKYISEEGLKDRLRELTDAFYECSGYLDKETIEKIEKSIMDLKVDLENK